MKTVTSLFMLLVIATSLFAQEKVVKHDGKGKSWINTIAKGFIITSGRAADLETAKHLALDNVKQDIVQSVADHIQVVSTQKTTELNGDVNSFLTSYNSEIKSESGDVSFLKGITLNKVEGWYWEKVKNKTDKSIFFRYYLKYPFSEQELNSLIAAYEKYDRDLTDMLNTELSIINNSNSLDEVFAANTRLQKLSGTFKDQRKQKLKSGLAVFKAIMQSLTVVPIDNSPGRMLVELKSGSREFIVSKTPRVSSPCAEILEVKNVENNILVNYNFDYCNPGNEQNYIEFYFSIGSTKIKDIVYFNVSTFIVELSVNGRIEIDLINNLAKISIPIFSTYSTPFIITDIELELPNNTIAFDNLNFEINIKGQHIVKASKALGDSEVKAINSLGLKTISGRIYHSLDEESSSSSIRFYKADFVLVK